MRVQWRGEVSGVAVACHGSDVARLTLSSPSTTMSRRLPGLPGTPSVELGTCSCVTSTSRGGSGTVEVALTDADSSEAALHPTPERARTRNWYGDLLTSRSVTSLQRGGKRAAVRAREQTGYGHEINTRSVT